MVSEQKTRRPQLRRASRALLVIACGAACLLAPSAATAMPSPAGDGALSPRLAELATPAVRPAPRTEQAAQLGLAAAGPGSLLRAGDRVLVDVRFDHGAEAALGALRAAGAEIVEVSQRYQTVTVATSPADLPDLGEVARVGAVTEVLAPIVRGADCGGAVRSEGDAQLNADNARASFGIDGSGVTVGILSDSFDRALVTATRAAGDVASGDLPGTASPCGSAVPVNVLADPRADGSDEGRAMAQVVHDLAPGASLGFASAVGGELAFASNIKALVTAGAKVIADDVAYFEEPFFQDGPVAVAVNEAAAAGVSYFSAAGNDNLVDKEEHGIGSWEAPKFRDTGCPPALAVAAETSDCMDFDPGPGVDPGFGITVAADATLVLDLQWAEPWNGVATDLDAFLLDSEGNPLEVKNGKGESVLVGSAVNNIASQRPVEVVQWKNDTGASAKVQLAINDCLSACNPEANGEALPRLKFVLLQNGGGVTKTDYPQSSGGDTVGPTIFGHAAAAGAIAVAAVPYNNVAEPERYSSRGPVTHYFGPVIGVAAAAAIPAQTIAKPDIAASDCGMTTFFSRLEAGVWRFCGTSSSAPHAAAVAALMRQANPGAGAAEIRSALTSRAQRVGAFGPSDVGAGLLDAYGAVDALALPPTVTITTAPPALSRNRRPTIQFKASRPVAFSCAVDGGSPQPCASPFSVPFALGDGPHGFAVTGTDVSGRVGSSGVALFSVDTRPPRTRIAKHPPKLVRTHRRRARAVFRFRSNEPGVTFVCKVDRDLPRFCGRRIARRFEEGRHAVKVRARDEAGNIDRTPAVFRFRVKRMG